MKPQEYKKAGRITVEKPTKTIRQYFGFVAPLLVLVPSILAAVYRAFFYRGCMDGFGLQVAALYGFVIGGLANLTFLIYVFYARRRYFAFSQSRSKEIAGTGVILSALLIPAQIVILLARS